MRVFVATWQQQCCGKPFGLGDEVAWQGAPPPAGDTLGVDLFEDHHDMVDRERRVAVNGVVRRIEPVDDGMVVELAVPEAFAGEGWTLELPVGVVGQHVAPPPDSPYATMAVARGRLEPTDVPVTIVVTTRPRGDGVTLRSEMRRLHGEAGSEAEVPGARGARRAEGRVEDDDGVEHLSLVVAASRTALVTLTIRTPPEVADPHERVAAIVRSLRID